MKKLSIIAIVLSIAFTSVFAQVEQREQMLDLTSSFALQNVPIMEGMEEFQDRLDSIRAETGREPLGLVLCGGSARAFAHIGVLKAMEENEVKPDFIVANSMGAIIGMLYAYGFSPDKILEIVTNLELTSYFEPVLPIKGGVLNVRNFRSLINQLLGKPSTDVSECAIPILVLTEDLESKRQLFMARGDFAHTLTAAIAMPAIMEYTKYTNPDGVRYDLFDSGAIDIGGIEVAERYSSNIIVSSAFYDVKVNYNNPIVFLNRMASVGKERAAVEDLKQFNPVLIRNDVEHFSFMAFDKAEELTEQGYKTAVSVMDAVKSCPHGNTDISERRAETDILADNLIESVRRGKSLDYKEVYAGFKIWPQVAAVELPEFSLYEDNGLSLFGFIEGHVGYARLGLTAPFTFNHVSADSLIKVTPCSFIELKGFASYSAKITKDGFDLADFYAAGSFKYKPQFLPECFKSFYINGEVLTKGNFDPLGMLYTAGLEFELGKPRTAFLYIKPYYFMSGSNIKTLSGGAGGNIEALINFSTFSKKNWKYSGGIAGGFGARYAGFNINESCKPQTRLYSNDFFRGYKVNGEYQFMMNAYDEIYFVSFDTGITFAELIILKEFKAGMFNSAYYCRNMYPIENSPYYLTSKSATTGLFARANVSLIGLSDFILEIGGGAEWNPATEQQFSPFGYFAMKTRM